MSSPTFEISADPRLAGPSDNGTCFFLDALLDAFQRNADRIAVIHEGGTRTYADLLDETFRLARALESRGLGRGDGVAVLEEHTYGVLVISLACRVAGCYFVGIPTYTAPAEQARMLDFAKATVLVHEPASAPRAAELARRSTIRETLSLGPAPDCTDVLALAAEQPGTPFAPPAKEDDLAELLYTSGSSGGMPKAATYTFERLGVLVRAWQRIGELDTAEAAAYRDPDCRLLRFVASTVSPGVAVVPTLLNGGSMVVRPGFDPGVALRAIEEHRATVLAMYPSHLSQLLDHPSVTEVDLSSVRLVVLYGAPASPARLKQAMTVFGPVLCQIYGQSETRMVCHLQPDDHEDPHLLRSVGRPRPGVDLEIRTDTGLAPTREIGEIYVRTPYCMTEYWRDPELTEETFVDGWIRTTDLGYLDEEGYVYLVDRLRDIVMVNANNCYTVDIENLLSGHPAVRQAVVFGLPDSRTGEAVHIAVVRHPHIEVSETELRELVRTELGEYEVPRSVTFLDEVPVTRAGKPDKNTVREWVSRRYGSPN